jgi:hypothetical protein
LTDSRVVLHFEVCDEVSEMGFSKLAIVAPLLFALLLCFDAGAEQYQRSAQSRSGATRRAVPAESDLARSRAEVMQRIKETRDGAEKLLELHEAERLRAEQEYQRRRELYHRGLIARNDVLQAEHGLARAILKVDEDKRWIAETDMAMTEVSMRDELLRLPRLALGAYSETSTFLRFNGGTLFRLGDASRVEKFFVEAFGRALPISALGQTATHDRLRFDHRDAMDVALHPDSKEGRSLLSYLRQSGIPFVAFRSAVPGASTGAHIHIGKPSSRL